MSHSRALVAAAIGAGALYVVGFAALGSPPEATDSPRDVADWFAEHRDGVRIYAWSATFGTLAFAVFAALVPEALPTVAGRVFLIGALAFIVETVVQAWFWAGLSLHPDSLDPETARTLLDVVIFWGPLLTGATMTMIGAVTVLGLRGKPLIPRWLTVLGIVAFVEQAVETITVFGTEGFVAPGGDMNLLFGAGITSVFLVGLVVWAAGRLASGSGSASGQNAAHPLR